MTLFWVERLYLGFRNLFKIFVFFLFLSVKKCCAKYLRRLELIPRDVALHENFNRRKISSRPKTKNFQRTPKLPIRPKN